LPKSVSQKDSKSVSRGASAESETEEIREREDAARKTDSKKLGGVSAGTGTGTGTGTGSGAGVGAEEGSGAGTGTGLGLGMVFELDAVLSPLVKTPYSAFGHTHHITGKRRGEWGVGRRATFTSCLAI
jgi:hypothetical protein